MQSHYFTEHPDPSQVEASIQRFIKAGLLISVSELDVGYGHYNGPTITSLTQEQQINQAIYFARIFEIYKAYSSHFERVTIWGNADSMSWRYDYSPVLFDGNYAPKQAFNAVIDPNKYLTKQNLTSRSLYDLVISTDTTKIVGGIPSNIYVKAKAADLGKYDVVAYITKNGIKCSPDFKLTDGSANIIVPKGLAVGQYKVVVDANNESILFASKSVPLTISIGYMENLKLTLINKILKRSKLQN
jgi:hypothetical protein